MITTVITQLTAKCFRIVLEKLYTWCLIYKFIIIIIIIIIIFLKKVKSLLPSSLFATFFFRYEHPGGIPLLHCYRLDLSCKFNCTRKTDLTSLETTKLEAFVLLLSLQGI